MLCSRGLLQLLFLLCLPLETVNLWVFQKWIRTAEQNWVQNPEPAFKYVCLSLWRVAQA